MAGFNHLFRRNRIITYNAEVQALYNNLETVTTQHNMDTVFIADDSEWDSSAHSRSYHDKDNADHRWQSDVISHQYVIKYANFPTLGIVIFRNENDPTFHYWDLISCVRYYLNYVGYREDYEDGDIRRLASQLGIEEDEVTSMLGSSSRVPPITYVGFFTGVDATAYEDWQTYLASQKHSKKDPNFITLNKQEFFSAPYSIIVRNPNSRRIKYPVTLKFVDDMALGPQGGLAALGSIVNQPKINTKVWDLEDDLISYRDFINPMSSGYYKQHMRYLLDQRPDDYLAYALGDSEITLKYLSVLLGHVIKVYDQGLIERVHIPATLTSLADEISSTFSQLPYDENTIVNIYNDIFYGTDINQFLRPAAYNQVPPKARQHWEIMITLAVKGLPLPGEKSKFGTQYAFIEKLKPYLARNTIRTHLSRKGERYQRLIGTVSHYGSKDYNAQELARSIDYRQLYRDNPDFDIIHLEDETIRTNKHHFKVTTRLLSKYADHAHQFLKTKSNVPPTLQDVLDKLYNSSVNATYIVKGKVVPATPALSLAPLLDFDRMRKGYDFEEPSRFDKKHQKGSHDQFSVRPDSVYNDGYQMAVHAYVGGMNLSYNSGIINTAYRYKYDIDLKSSYVNAGHLIADFRLDTKPILDRRDITQKQLVQMIYYKPGFFPNGPFTVGVANVSYWFNDDVKRVPVGYKPPIKGAGPVYVRQATRVDMTLTDVFDIIKHGGQVKIHRLIIPEQKSLNGDVSNLAPIGRMQHWSLMERNKAKQERNKYSVDSPEYRKYDSLQLFYKLLGNGGYGKSGQGLGAGGTRDFLTGETMYVPFSRNTNPYTAAQYTSIARWQVNALMDLAEKTYPDSLIPSVTTDGFIFCTNNKLNENQLRQACEQTFNPRWIQVNHANFNDEYFELKSHNHGQTVTAKPLINIRTRFNLTSDNHIKALVGLRPGEWNAQKIIKMLDNDVVTFKVNDLRMQSLIDMKHTIDHKRYTSMKTWNQPKYLNLSPDDTYQPTGFVEQGDFGYFLTRPFYTVDEEQTYKAELKPYRSIFPIFRREYGEAFSKLDQSVKKFFKNDKPELHVDWVFDDVPLRGKDYPSLLDYYRHEYVPQVMIRYIAQQPNQYDLKKLYTSLFTDRYKRFSSFNQAIKRATGKFVNPLCVIKEDIPEQLKKYLGTSENKAA